MNQKEFIQLVILVITNNRILDIMKGCVLVLSDND